MAGGPLAAGVQQGPAQQQVLNAALPGWVPRQLPVLSVWLKHQLGIVAFFPPRSAYLLLSSRCAASWRGREVPMCRLEPVPRSAGPPRILQRPRSSRALVPRVAERLQMGLARGAELRGWHKWG